MNQQTAKQAAILFQQIEEYESILKKLDLLKSQSFKKMYIVLESGLQIELESKYLTGYVSRSIINVLFDYNTNELKAKQTILNDLH